MLDYSLSATRDTAWNKIDIVLLLSGAYILEEERENK